MSYIHVIYTLDERHIHTIFYILLAWRGVCLSDGVLTSCRHFKHKMKEEFR